MIRLDRLNCGPLLLMTCLAAVMVGVTTSFATAGQFFEGPFDILIGELPPLSDEPVELGNITSDGNGVGPYVRPTESFDLDHHHRTYPPFTQSPNSPAQGSLALFENAPLTLVIPMLSHQPWIHTLDVTHAIEGFDITVNSEAVVGLVATATIYGPNEYLLPLGLLDAGHYRLTLDRKSTFRAGLDLLVEQTSASSGFLEFTVHAVPEPCTVALLATGIGCLIVPAIRLARSKPDRRHRC